MGRARDGILGFGYEMPSLKAGGEGVTCLYNSSMQEAETEKSAQGHPNYTSLRSAWATRERNECEKGARRRKGGRGRKEKAKKKSPCNGIFLGGMTSGK